MTPEEIQAKIDAAVEEATEGLKKKNSELLAEVKKFKKGDFDPAEIEKLETLADDLKSKLSAAEKQLKTATKELETTKAGLAAESKFTQGLLIDNGLTAELTKAGVTNPALLKAATTMLRNGAQVVADGENRVAKVGDKPLSDFVKEWAATDEGKHFISAAGNSGGGAPPSGGGSGQSKTMTRAQFDGLAPADKVKFSVEGGRLT